MKKKLLLRLLTLSIALLIAVSALSACDSSGNPSDTAAPAQTEPPISEFSLSEDWVLVRSDLEDTAMDAVRYLRKAIKDVFGFEPALKNDFLMKDQMPGKHEILVGTTNRENAASFYEGLTAKDFGYQIVSGGTIIIAGGNAESCVKAAERFMRDLFGYTGEGTGKTAPVTVGAGRLVKYSYPVTSLLFDGNPIADYTIVHANNAQHKAAAEALASEIENLTGISVPVAKSASAVKTKYTITVGTSQTAKGAYVYELAAEKGDFSISAGTTAAESAVDAFLAKYLPADSKGKVSVSLPTKPESYYAFNEIETYNLVYQNTTDKTVVCPGVTRYTRHYIDRNGAPTKVYVIECAPGSVKPVLGTKNGEYSITGTQQILTQISQHETKYGGDVCAAVNGCLYRWSGNVIEPFGTCIKDGRIVTDLFREAYAMFAVKKDGSYFFGYPTADKINLGTVDQAVSGAYMLIDNYELVDMGLTSHDPGFAHTRHPRTAIGAREDGTLFFLVVDGRQAGFSLGATLPDLALIFRELDCQYAVNIDGGGSSISYTKNYATGQYTMWNKPSDGSPRAVINCMLIVRNPDYKEP